MVVLIAAAIGPWTLLVVAVLIIGTLKCCLTTDSDSIDESINKSPGIVAHVMVLDSTDNGFRVVYATAEPVTDERFAEICDRPVFWRVREPETESSRTLWRQPAGNRHL